VTDAAQPAVPEATPETTPGGPGEPPAERRMPSSQPVLLRALLWGSVATLALLIVCGGVGWLIAGVPGLVGGALGAAFAGVFLGLTIASIAAGNRLIESDFYVVAFFAIVVGGWVLKFVAFIVAAVLLRDQPWLDPKILFFSLIAGVLVSLAIDVVIVMKSRLPYISDPKPGA
jgi:hypothetical protein